MAENHRKPKTRRERIISNVRLLAVFAVSFVLFYQAFGPGESIEPVPAAVKREAAQPKPAPSIHAFSDPAAQHLAALGHALMDRPMERLYVARELQALTDAPESLGADPSVFLSLRAAYWQLRRDPQVSGSIDAAKMLWDAAEAIEVQRHVSSASRAVEISPVTR